MRGGVPSSGRVQAYTDNGLRFVGAAIRKLDSIAGEPEWDLHPDPLAEPIFGARLTLRAPAGGHVMPTVLELLHHAVQEDGVELPRLEKGHPLSLPADRTSGLVWRERIAPGAWVGELMWRAIHPTVPGARVTTRVVLEERPAFDRLTLQITADDGASAVHGPMGAGQVRPAWLDELARRFEVDAWGGPHRVRTLTALEVEDFVLTTLRASGRRHPVAVLSPEEEGGYALDPADIARELLGVAPLYVIDRHETTFVLTDTLGDRRLSCYFGALRLYMPGFTVRDDPSDHPLLVRDRLVDPVMRATELGKGAMWVAQALEMPPFLVEPNDDEAAAAPAADRGSVAAPPVRAEGAGEARALAAAEAVGGAPVEPAAGRPTPEEAPAPESALLLPALQQIIASLDRLTFRVEELGEEVDRLRTLTKVRSAGTTGLERQIRRLRDEVEARFSPELVGAVPTATLPPGGEEAEFDDEGSVDTLLEVVQAARDSWPHELLILEQALTSAAASPYEDPDRVGAVLEAMAKVARQRMTTGLGVPLREAFQEFGIDYRGGISGSTSARLREQYLFVDGESPVRTRYECFEHIALGNARDPRHCLRIYFTSRARAENRFVIGHVGTHFEIEATN